jgi:hypothetical protein
MGDTKYKGSPCNRVGSALLVEKFTEVEMRDMQDDQLFMDAMQFNEDFDTLRAPVEMNIGGSKRGSLVGDSSKIRASLKCSREDIRMLDELCCYLHAAVMRMRGQFHQSNPVVLRGGHKRDENVAAKIIAEMTGDGLLTEQHRKNKFFGSDMAGLGYDIPDPLPLSID